MYLYSTKGYWKEQTKVVEKVRKYENPQLYAKGQACLTVQTTDFVPYVCISKHFNSSKKNFQFLKYILPALMPELIKLYNSGNSAVYISNFANWIFWLVALNMKVENHRGISYPYICRAVLQDLSVFEEA